MSRSEKPWLANFFRFWRKDAGRGVGFFVKIFDFHFDFQVMKLRIEL